MAFNPELGSTSPAVLLDNAERLDKLVNGPAADVPDRGGDPLYSWRQIMAVNQAKQDQLDDIITSSTPPVLLFPTLLPDWQEPPTGSISESRRERIVKLLSFITGIIQEWPRL